MIEAREEEANEGVVAHRCQDLKIPRTQDRLYSSIDEEAVAELF